MLKFSEFFEFSSENSWILQEFWPNSDLNSSFGSVPRRSNLSTKAEAESLGGSAYHYYYYSGGSSPGENEAAGDAPVRTGSSAKDPTEAQAGLGSELKKKELNHE